VDGAAGTYVETEAEAEARRDAGDRAPATVPAAATESPPVSGERDPGPQVLDALAWTEGNRTGDRRPWSGRLRLRWSHLGSLDDTSLLSPVSIEVLRGSVVVSDLGASRLVAYDRFAPRQLWTAGREGSGPGEFRRPFLSRDTDSTVLVVDGALRRLQVVRETGAFGPARSLAAFGGVGDACRRPDGDVWLFLSPSGDIELRGLGLLDARSDSLRLVAEVPFGVPMHPSGMGGSAALERSPDGACLLAPLYFPWVGPVSPEAAVETNALVEAVPPPEVVITPLGTTSRRITLSDATVAITRTISASTDHVWVVARGRSDVRGRVVDVYRREPWRYEGSLVFPHAVRDIAVRDSTFAAIVEDPSGYHRVIVATFGVPTP